MRSYTNKNGEKITVNEEHLITAVSIKKELQKSSPSRKASWSLLVKLMEKEGYFDSENSEAYRCMIKAYQKSINELPEAPKYADMVSESKLQSIKELVGEVAYGKRENQNVLRELNKVKREVIDSTLFVEEVSNSLRGISFDETVFEKPTLHKTDNAITVMMTDWHIGLKTGNYNYEIAKQRVRQYADRIIHYTRLFNVGEVHVLGIGDLVEGGYLRPTQAYEIEFTYSEQIVKATEIVNSFLIMLSQELNVIYLGSVLGNHSRMYDKGVTISGDSAENVVDSSIKSFIKMLNNPRIIVEDKKKSNFDIVFELNGKIVKAVHGDLLKKSSSEKITKFISSDNILYDLLLYGHFHHFDLKEENHNRLTVGAGCLQGTTDYSKQLGYDTVASQSIIVFEGSNILPIRIVLE